MKLKLFVGLMFVTLALAGCVGNDDGSDDDSTSSSTGNVVTPPNSDTPGNTVVGVDSKNSTSNVVVGQPMTFELSYTGYAGPEPSVGVTSSGCIFTIALDDILRSCDAGATWEEIAQHPQCQDGTSDPYLWVDPATDRIFGVQMVSLVATWVCWSDDDGATWLGNPYDQGPLPVNDHIKLGTGPYTAAGYGMLSPVTSILYDQATYFCYNKLVGVFCYTSFDGGITFPVGGQIIGLATTGAGLHGAISTAPDGTVYVPPRVADPTLLYSKDNGFTWTSVSMGQDVGTTNPRKNSEVAADEMSNAYHVWTGEDQRVYLSRSLDSGVTWDAESIPLSPEAIISTTFPQIDAGSEGHFAVAYLGSTDSDMLGVENINGQGWDGNAHFAPSSGVTYDLYLTYSTNAHEAEPTFTTVKLTSDPVQIGSICLNSGDCRDIGGSNRNLLDFNDLHLDRDGRVYIAYADGCTGECADNWRTLDAEASRSRELVVAIQQLGPAMFAESGMLEAL